MVALRLPRCLRPHFAYRFHRHHIIALPHCAAFSAIQFRPLSSRPRLAKSLRVINNRSRECHAFSWPLLPSRSALRLHTTFRSPVCATPKHSRTSRLPSIHPVHSHRCDGRLSATPPIPHRCIIPLLIDSSCPIDSFILSHRCTPDTRISCTYA